MRKSIQRLPPGSRSPSLPWLVLPDDMNLKNFPMKLDSKISPLRISVPENLDLALEGLIRKVLREQPKVDDIYTFAADYFDKLLKIRDKVGPKFTADQLCPFHNDEDAHEMIKLANSFTKPGVLQTKPPETEKTKNADAKGKRKEFSKSTGKLNKTAQNTKAPAVVKKKAERAPGKRKDQKLNETKPERPKTLELEPKTEDFGEDEEFLKSDPIKTLVEKELMDATKSEKNKQNKDKKDEKKTQPDEKMEEARTNEELCTVIDKDSIQSEEKKPGVTVTKTKDEETELPNIVTDKKEDEKDKKEEKAVDKTEITSQNMEKDETQTEAPNSAEDTRVEKSEKDYQNDAKDGHPKIQSKNPEDAHIEVLESLSTEKEIQKPFENESKEDAKNKNTTDAETLKEDIKEISEAQNVVKDKSTDKIIEPESIRNDEKEAQIKTDPADAAEGETAEAPQNTEEVDINPDELCMVVDVLSIKSLEKREEITEKAENNKEKEPVKEESINEEKIKTEELPNEEKKEVAEIQKSTELVETAAEHNIANNEDKNISVISSTGKEIQQNHGNLTTEQVKDIDNPSDTENFPVEKLKSETESEDSKTNVETAVKKEEVKTTDLKDIKPESLEDQITTEDKLKDTENEVSQTTEEKEKPEATDKNKGQDMVTKEGNLKREEKPSENKEAHVTLPETEAKPEVKDIKLQESTSVEARNGTETVEKSEKEEKLQEKKKTDEESNLKPEEVDSVKAEKEPSNVKEEQTNEAEVANQHKSEKELQNEEVKTTEEAESVKEVENEIKDAEKEKQKDEDNTTEVFNKANIEDPTLPKDSEKKESLTVHESLKPSHEPNEPVEEPIAVESRNLPETNKISEPLTGEAEQKQSIAEDESSNVLDTHHVIKVEEAEKLPEETAQPEGVQIKTIQTHYYNTLQVPEQITKEYRVHAVENDFVLNKTPDYTNTDVPYESEQATASVTAPEQPKEELDKTNLEDTLMTLSSKYSRNLSELSVRAISEMFLNSEKEYSSLDREERRFVTKPGDTCGDESRTDKQEVEEIIHKMIDPFTTGATPVAPRDDSRINEEANMEGGLANEKKENLFVDSNEAIDSSNEGRSIDSDTPIISLEVKTVIETQIADEEKNGDGSEQTGREESDVQIRIQTTIDVPEGVIVDVREEKAEKEEVRQHADDKPTSSESVPKESQTSSGESDSTMSSTATEIKRSDTAKRRFSSTRTLIATQSLDRDKRNPLLKTRSLSFRQGVTDFEVWNAIERELEVAATKIQSNFRGYKTRKKLQRENAVQITTEESSSSASPVEADEERMRTTGEFHDSIILSEHPR